MTTTISLTETDRAQLREQGWLRVPGVLPEPMRLQALRTINASIGAGVEPSQVAVYNASSFCPELRSHPDLLGLFEASPARALVEGLFGRGAVLPVTTAQIALRFPTRAATPPPITPHIDGFPSPGNGVPAGSIHAFAALAAVFLEDVRGPWAGNFTVWPGSHRALGAWFRAHGADPSLPAGIPPSLAPGAGPGGLGEALQIEARAGDLVLCPYLLAHAAAANLSPHIRYAVFFRLQHAVHDGRPVEALLRDPFLGWKGL